MSSIAPADAEAPLILTIDAGSSSTRVLLFDGHGRMVDGIVAHERYTVQTTAEGAAEDDPDAALARIERCIDAALSQFGLDAVVTATDNPAWATDLIFGDHFLFGSSGLAAPEGYPIIQVPAAMVYGAPMGISFFGTAFSALPSAAAFRPAGESSRNASRIVCL